MRTRCPQCHTEYDIDARALEMAQGMARCFNCNTVFNAQENSEKILNPGAHESHRKTSVTRHQQPDYKLQLDFDAEPPDRETAHLPFDVPDDLPELQPSDRVLPDLEDTLYQTQKNASPWWQKTFFFLLLLGILAQLLWFYRIPLMQRPEAQPLCRIIDCSEAQQRDTDAFVVLHREMEPRPDQPGTLRFLLQFRNAAAFAQPWPELQLALFDNNEKLLVRRRISTREYDSHATINNRLIAPLEVVTIELSFEDPGSRASGFEIDFL